MTTPWMTKVAADTPRIGGDPIHNEVVETEGAHRVTLTQGTEEDCLKGPGEDVDREATLVHQDQRVLGDPQDR